MARPREFDEEQVIGSAREAFWSNGFHDTSITDLSAATGLSVGSIYKAFGSKADLCARTLDDYLEFGLVTVRELLDQPGSPVEGIERWLGWIAELASGDGPTRGCYAVALTSELAATDEAIRRRLQRHDDRILGLLADAIRAANASGELRGDPQIGARLLTAAANGVQLEARKGIDRSAADATLRLALDALR
ncbi:MAG: TetR/AcrR family transcriptional regulator [Actinomycetota bacterium]